MVFWYPCLTLPRTYKYCQMLTCTGNQLFPHTYTNMHTHTNSYIKQKKLTYHVPLLSGHPNISICQQSRPNVSILPVLMTSLNRLATIGRSREKYPDDVSISSTRNDYIIMCEWEIETCSFNNLISDKLP